MLTYDRWKKNIFPHWGLDFEVIRQSKIDATFNVYNFSRHKLEVLAPPEMSSEALTACVSLPTWFPPVEMNRQLYIDSVYMTDANLIEAARRGVDELWVIWTVSKRSVWKNGLLHNYFQVIETAANGRLHADIARIERNNREIANHQTGEFGKHIEIKMLNAEVPLHYLINFSSQKFTKAVDLGVQEARRWCLRNQVTLATDNSHLARGGAVESEVCGLSFSETMKGSLSADESEYALSVALKITIEDVDKFIEEHDHAAVISGSVDSTLFGGVSQVNGGTFNLFIDTAQDRKKMRYLIWVLDSNSKPFTIFGEKNIHDDPGFDVWQDTTTLFTTVYHGHLDQSEFNESRVVAKGIIRIFLHDFIQQISTFRTTGSSLKHRTATLARFGKFFMGSIWDIYGPRAFQSK